MNKLAKKLSSIVLEKVRQATLGRAGTSLESRFIFHGPPIELLEMVYDELSSPGGIKLRDTTGEGTVLPVLLQVPAGEVRISNPSIGSSGQCDETHLLNLRNVPSSPSYIALVPPGQHSNRSVASTTDEFGVSASNNSGHATFDEWWGDEFIQHLLSEGLADARLTEGQQEEAKILVEYAARAMDEVDQNRGTRKAAWHLLSRIFSLQPTPDGLSPAHSLSLACGIPPQRDEGLSAKGQPGVLQQLADALADGFKVGLEHARQNCTENEADFLDDFHAHIQERCKVPTAFERATPAFYLPEDGLEVTSPPNWWKALTVERWSELLAEESVAADDLLIDCTNQIFPTARGIPVLVHGAVNLSISTGKDQLDRPVDAILERIAGGASGKLVTAIQVAGNTPYVDQTPPMHKVPIRYKVEASGHKGTAIKVVSLESWSPGLFVSCRMARKLSPPRKPARKAARLGFDWETALSVPGAGRYELTVFVSPHAIIGSEAIGIQDDAAEVDGDKQTLTIHQVRQGEYQIEIDADGKYQLDIPFKRTERDGSTVDETCRVYVACEETDEEGCRSEFERLIKLNRRHLEQFDAKSVVQLDRHARSSSLQSWMLDEHSSSKSFLPIVIANDYASNWVPPNWGEPAGPVLSQGRFLHDPRPMIAEFLPPPGFIESRQRLAERIRGTDEQSGLLESAPLGQWVARDQEFKELVEVYLDSYQDWLGSDPDVACWVDTVIVTSLEQDGRTLSRVPDAILLSPLHPLRLAWHCVAQHVLYKAVEDGFPCPAASILDPDSAPDLMTMSLHAPGGIERVDFLSVECNSDYWSVLWNGARLRQLTERSRIAPFDGAFGITVGGISSGFSAAQVSRALEDVSDLLSAKPIVSLVVSSAGGTTDACNEGLVAWCTRRFGNGDTISPRQGIGPRMVQVFDTRADSSRPDEATISNLSEDTGNLVRWFDRQPAGSIPDLGIIAQLDSSEPETTSNAMRSPLGPGGLIRHRVRRQLSGANRAFLSESRQGLPMPPSGDVLLDKVASCMLALENRQDGRVGLRFAPNVHAVRHMLEEQKADFVAVSSAAIDPACFLGGWLQGAYLWDYDLPSYSNRAGDTNGYYLLSQVKDADRDGLGRVLSRLPGCDQLPDDQIEQILLEVARRGIPTVRGLSGDDTGATGDLGLFLAVRLLQDQFRTSDNADSLLPVLVGTEAEASIAIIIPVDPFRGYLGDLARSLRKDRRDMSLSRPDLLVVGMHIGDGPVRIHLTPIEVKCRQGSTFPSSEVEDALGQAKALSSLLYSMEVRSEDSLAWRLTFQHLLLSMIGFGLRVYSQHDDVSGQAGRWASYHERIAAAILGPDPSITIDSTGRLIIIDESVRSDSYDRDGDGFEETIVIATSDATRIVAGDAQGFYDAVRAKVGNWSLLPQMEPATTAVPEGFAATIPKEIAATPADVSPSSSGVVQPYMDNMAAFQPAALSEPSSPEAVPPYEQRHTGIVLAVGRTTDGFEPRALSLNISDTRLNQLNMGVVGDLGTGKTQLLKSLIFQISAEQQENRGIAPRFLIFDYKRDYSSPDFVAATGARVVKPTQLPLNLFDTSSMGESPAPWLDRFRFFADVLDKIYSGIGPVQRDKLKGAVRSAYESCATEGRHPTIYDIHAAYRELLGGKSDAPMAIIDDLVDMEVFARDPRDAVQFDQFLNGVVVISLDAMGQDDRSKNMLVAIMLNMFYENMLKTPKRPFEGTDPQLRVIDSYLLVDEADNIMRYEFDVLRKLLLQGREFGVGVILASQYLRHFKVNATDYRDPLLTWFVHKVPNVTPSELGALGITSDLAELSDRVKTLPNHHCLYKSFNVAGEVIRGMPFYELENTGGKTGVE
ncbi:MAG: type IV secretory system conjugative DNA transfer family protein [Sulfuricella sp.]|nr:type IV secretory system conjugative DNA transfer family protein [Sulfuricella sp.]